MGIRGASILLLIACAAAWLPGADVAAAPISSAEVRRLVAGEGFPAPEAASHRDGALRIGFRRSLVPGVETLAGVRALPVPGAAALPTTPAREAVFPRARLPRADAREARISEHLRAR